MAGTVASCHDLSDGGLAVAAAEAAFSGGHGVALSLANVPWKGELSGKSDSALLFSESASRLLVTVRPEKRAEFEALMAGSTFAAIGTVTAEPTLHITGLVGNAVVASGLAELKESWQSPLRDL